MKAYQWYGQVRLMGGPAYRSSQRDGNCGCCGDCAGCDGVPPVNFEEAAPVEAEPLAD
jgi:hypothetical protein